MIPSFEARHSLGGRACPCFGGDSSSANATNNTTNNTDARKVFDASGAAGNSLILDIGGNGNALSVMTTDYGAISGAVDIAKTGISGAVDISKTALNTNANNVETLMSAAEHLFTQQQASLDSNITLTKALAGTAQQAYSDATSQASGQKNLILVGVAVVGIVAFASLKGH